VDIDGPTECAQLHVLPTISCSPPESTHQTSLLSIKPFTEAGKEFNGSSPRCFVRIGIAHYFMTMQETQQIE